MKHIDPFPELTAALAFELAAGRAVTVPGLGTFRAASAAAETDDDSAPPSQAPAAEGIRILFDADDALGNAPEQEA